MSEKIALVLTRDRHPRPEQGAIELALLSGLEHRPELELSVVPHLYDLAHDGPAVQMLRSVKGDLIVLAWLYPRSVFWVLDANLVKGRLGRTISLGEEEPLEPAGEAPGRGEVPDRTIWCFDLRTHDDPEFFVRQVNEIVAAKVGPAERAGMVVSVPNGKAKVLEEATRPRWYPVVDLERCTECKECLNFCLFGVYAFDQSGAIFVEQPDACRPGCPACARICPAGAIMFPQHNDPAIAGDPEASLQGLKLDLSQIFAGVDPAMLAAQERKRALADVGTPTEDPSGRRAQPSAEKPTLDELVDRVDELDL
jgi:NAD-dependent dihydropyrimidine dehydrogenase PreA subunit